MFKIIVSLAVLAISMAFAPSARTIMKTSSLQMSSAQSQISKAFGIAAMGIALAGPITIMPNSASADGAVSASTVYRSRNNYGAKIMALKGAADSGDFSKFEEKKIVNAFDLFISGSNALKSTAMKETKKVELVLEAKIFNAVKAKDAATLKSTFAEFIKVADLKSDYKPGELGQTDGSGNSPTWGTDRQYIYQR